MDLAGRKLQLLFAEAARDIKNCSPAIEGLNETSVMVLLCLMIL